MIIINMIAKRTPRVRDIIFNGVNDALEFIVIFAAILGVCMAVNYGLDVLVKVIAGV